VNCNVTKRGWMAGIGGCPNVGGICIGCTMHGFPDKFMPFMDEPPGGVLSSGPGLCVSVALCAAPNWPTSIRTWWIWPAAV
jgi:Ni,Fe-hydrogenase I small subunit